MSRLWHVQWRVLCESLSKLTLLRVISAYSIYFTEYYIIPSFFPSNKIQVKKEEE